MKSDAFAALMNASWPVLLVDESGLIHNANTVAAQTFGPGATNGSTPLSSFWLPANEASVTRFLIAWETSPTALTPLKLRGGNCE